MLVYKTRSEIETTINQDMENLGLLNTSNISLLQGLITIFSDDVKALYDNLYSIDRSRRPTVMIGDDLDEFCRLFGLRRGIAPAAADLSSTNFKFYLSDGLTAKEVTLSQSGFTLSAGYTVSDGANEFVTIDTAVFTPDSNSAYVRIVSAGSITGLIPPNSIREHTVEITDIPDIDPDVDVFLECSNDRAISAGVTNEGDSALRSRLYSRALSMNNTNEDALLFALQSIGIPNVRFHNDFFGIGTIGVELLIGSPVISDYAIEVANATISRLVPYARVVRPEYLTISLQVRIEVNQDTEVSRAQQRVINAITEYFDAVEMGRSVSIAEIESIVNEQEGIVRGSIVCFYINGRRALLNVVQRADRDQKYVLAIEDPIEFVIGA